jgi:hypothetical protein
VRRAYRANLEAALPAVGRLLDGLDGRVVVTSDHGNCVGERAWPVPIREWGHPEGIYVRPLVAVPWLVVEGDRRRAVSRGGRTVALDADGPVDEVAARLGDLGYVE